jgi:hypothetical protein
LGSAFSALTVPFVNNRRDRLLGEIEAGALDSRIPIADVLRKVVVLGGKAGSAKLRDWATRELDGYNTIAELPQYRHITAPLHIDWRTPFQFMKGQQIDPSELPEIARKDIDLGTDLPLMHGIGQLEQMTHGAEPGKMLQLQLASFPLIVNLMNLEGQWHFNVERLYWSVSPTALQGVIDQVRTKLAVLVSEMSATMPAGAEIPSAEVATNAFSVAVEGKRSTVTFTSAQGGSTITSTPPEEPRKWLRTAAAVVIGLAGIVGLFFAIMEVQGWSF